MNVVISAEAAIELVPVIRERLADLETPVSAFAKLRSLGGAFLLESAEGGERMGRYSFIGVAPRETLYFRGMHGDKLPSGTRTVNVVDSQGGSVPDEPSRRAG